MKQGVVRHSGGIAIAWALFILVLCATPGHFIPAVGWLQLLSFDKLVHATLFFVLAALIIIAARKAGSAERWLLLAAILYGVLIEVLQATLFVGRSFEWFDALADAAGVLMAVMLRRRVLRWSLT